MSATGTGTALMQTGYLNDSPGRARCSPLSPMAWATARSPGRWWSAPAPTADPHLVPTWSPAPLPVHGSHYRAYIHSSNVPLTWFSYNMPYGGIG